ncbi:phytanoyl-CoA dioxygenase family protein [Umezawaea sp.]|uniref:phytanoyl-CoA dioxygenase family protein n=1 Tax=Umezawaea sp. TaxID=1955258 RepID=UPI002ED4CB26
MPISDDHVEQLVEEGRTLVPDFLDAATLAECGRAVAAYFPTGEEWAAAPDKYRGVRKSAGFPYQQDVLNEVSTHPDLQSFVERVLGRDDVRLGDSLLQAKYGPALGPVKDQRLHNDAWGRNTLVHPPRRPEFQRVFAIVYYTDVEVDLAPTYAVPAKLTRDVPLLTRSGEAAYDRADYPELYEQEQPVVASAGSVLLFSGHTVHRGSAVRRPTGHRFAHFLNFHSARSTWLDKQGWPGSPAAPNGPAVRRLVESASPHRRELLGFPAVDSDYWTEEALAGTAALYPGLDLAPYRR